MKANMLVNIAVVVAGAGFGWYAGKLFVDNGRLSETNRKLQSEVNYLNSKIKDDDARALRSILSMKQYYEFQITDSEDTLKKVDETNKELVTKLSKAGVENIQLMEKVEDLTARLNHKKLKRKNKQ